MPQETSTTNSKMLRFGLQQALNNLETEIFAPTAPDPDAIEALEKVKNIIGSINKELNSLEKMDLVLASSYRDNGHLDSAQYHLGRAKGFADAARCLQEQ